MRDRKRRGGSNSAAFLCLRAARVCGRTGKTLFRVEKGAARIGKAEPGKRVMVELREKALEASSALREPFGEGQKEERPLLSAAGEAREKRDGPEAVVAQQVRPAEGRPCHYLLRKGGEGAGLVTFHSDISSLSKKVDGKPFA